MKLPVPPAMPLPPATPNWAEVADLAVQKQLADIAQWMMWLTAGQLLLAIAGTIALIVTLRESRRATSTAMRALHVQQSAERAVLVVKSQHADVGTSFLSDESTDGAAVLTPTIEVIVSIQNAGPSICLVRRTAIWVSHGIEPTEPGNDSDVVTSRHDPLQPEGQFDLSTWIFCDANTRAGLFNGSVTCWYHGFVEYEDLFGEPHRLAFAYRTVGNMRVSQFAEFGGDALWRSY